MRVHDNRAYRTLCERFGTAGRLFAAKITLFWDSQTYMPTGAAWSRGEQMAALDAARRDLIAAPDTDDLFAAADSAIGALDPVERANLSEMRRLSRHDAAVPKALMAAKAREIAKAQGAWSAAKQANDFSLFRGAFEALMPLYREIAAVKAEALGLAPYDALIDELDPGLTTALIDPIFEDLALTLPVLRGEVIERQAAWPAPIPFAGDFSVERQQALAYKLATAVGHSRDNLRIDAAPHPFSLFASPGDNRITTRFDPNNIRFAVMGTLHESGHALYEAALPREHAFLPVGAARGATVHESQSLMVEMQASRSREFLSWLAPQLEQAFGGAAACWSVANILNVYRRVDHGHIRLEADEISYPMHVILRYRIERALLNDDLAIGDLPGAWSDLSQALLGRRPPTHSVGCLQDFHWAAGFFAYFHNYTLGAILASQLFASAVRDDSAVLDSLRDGNFAPYRAWARARIHTRASEVSFSDLVQKATGAPLAAESLIRHLRGRYLEEAAPI